MNKKILFVNNNIEDCISLQERLGQSIDVEVLDQQSFRRTLNNFSLDQYASIIIDNDANNQETAQGLETIKTLREAGKQTDVLYTSFQPGWVPASVQLDSNTTIINTANLPAVLAYNLNISLQPTKKSEVNPELSVLISYNPVTGYEQGKQGNVIIVATEKRSNEEAPRIVKQQLDNIFGTRTLIEQRENIKNVFIYDGLSAGDLARNAAASVAHVLRMDVNLLACSCDWNEKINFANNRNLDLYQVRCGGHDEMGMIADIINNVIRPNTNYNDLKIPKEKILEPAKKYKL